MAAVLFSVQSLLDLPHTLILRAWLLSLRSPGKFNPSNHLPDQADPPLPSPSQLMIVLALNQDSSMFDHQQETIAVGKSFWEACGPAVTLATKEPFWHHALYNW